MKMLCDFELIMNEFFELFVFLVLALIMNVLV